MSSEVVIAARQLSKSYQMFSSPRARLLQLLVPRLQAAIGISPSRYYTNFQALQDVSFQVGRGETVGIIGRNGSGKSTLLQLICGTLTPSAGHIETNGRIAALLELGSGFNPEFTGRENVYLNAAVHGLKSAEIDAKFQDIAKFADIGDFIDRPIKTYSSGMVVRLAFATAIHVKPDILVVDEALAVGDAAFQQKCLDRIRQLQRSGVSILLVTHSMNALIEYCDRAIFLKRGKVVMDGACRDVVKAYADDLVLDEGGEFIDFIEDGSLREVVVESVQAENGEVASANGPITVESIALIDMVGKPCSAVPYGGEVRVRVEVSVSARISEPCFGIQLSSVDGISLWAATTQGMGQQMAALAPGKHRFEWVLRTPFSGNRYVVAIGVGQIVNGEYRRSHRVSYAGHFDVLPQPHSGGGWLAPSPAFRAPTQVAP